MIAAYRQKSIPLVILFECFCEISSFVRKMGDVILPAAGIILQRNDARVGFPESLSECCGGGGPLLDRQCHPRKNQFFQKFCIPAPVIGGLIFALLALGLRVSGLLQIEFDTTLQDVFMTTFFTSIGFSASFRLLKKDAYRFLCFSESAPCWS